MTARVSALVLLVAILKPDAAGAQSTREVRLDAGVAQVQQTGRDNRDAAGIFGLSWRESNPLLAAVLSATVTSAGDSASVAQATLIAAWRATERTQWLTEGGISVDAFGQSILARGGSFSGFIRERRAIDAGGIWVGAALGGTSRDDIASHSTALDIGGWWHFGDFEASASVARLRSEDIPLLQAAEEFLTGDATSYDLVDVTTDLRYEHGPFYLDATETFRNGLRATIANQSALYLSAVYTFSPRYSFIIGTGRLLADPVRGIPDAQVASAAIRVALIPVRTTAPPAERRGAAFALLSPKSSGALLVVRVVADDTAQVEVAGSFSGWKPVPLTRTGDAWEAEIALPPGSHRVAVRINGGPWQAPRGTARVKDDYGGSAGLIVVP
jgi:hypothetical protein